MNLLDPIKKIVIDRRDYLMNRAVLGEAFDGLLKYLALREKETLSSGVTTFSAGTTGFTPTVPTQGNVTLAGVLAASNGGTGLTGPFANGQLLIGNGAGFTAATLTAGAGISITNGPGSITITNTGGGGGGGTVTSVGLAVPTPASPAFSVSGSPVTTAGTLTINALGTVSQYIRGDGSLATFPTIPPATTVTGRTGDINVVTSGSNYEVQNAVMPFLLMGC